MGKRFSSVDAPGDRLGAMPHFSRHQRRGALEHRLSSHAATWSGVYSLVLDGQGDDERCSGSRSPAIRADVAAVSLDEGLGDRESDSRATVLAVAGGVDSVERSKRGRGAWRRSLRRCRRP